MGVREETLELLLQGNSPGKIARKKGVNIKTTLGYLNQMVGEGRVRRSDILLSIPAHQRQNPSAPYDKQVVLAYGDASLLLGDIYEDVQFVETTLHLHIRRVLEMCYGKAEGGWWRKGVPESIRKQCQVRREEDENPVDPYCYTDLIDLRTIIDKQWTVLKETLPNKFTSNKRQLVDNLTRLNQIRRIVMHPVRGGRPSEEDFDFLRALRRDLQVLAED